MDKYSVFNTIFFELKVKIFLNDALDILQLEVSKRNLIREAVLRYDDNLRRKRNRIVMQKWFHEWLLEHPFFPYVYVKINYIKKEIKRRSQKEFTDWLDWNPSFPFYLN